jgi:hypothetical protein
VEIMDKRLDEIEDVAITMLYNKAYGDPEEGAPTRKLAGEMLATSAVNDEGE